MRLSFAMLWYAADIVPDYFQSSAIEEQKDHLLSNLTIHRNTSSFADLQVILIRRWRCKMIEYIDNCVFASSLQVGP